ncbi:MAG: right-handed parallel beta-helix repeat-containing protein, partial [Planctomycetota bacterium]|nr:right-handed parallel beta-helix repeat-containing protein [Planctomycetota bacterium]
MMSIARRRFAARAVAYAAALLLAACATTRAEETAAGDAPQSRPAAAPARVIRLEPVPGDNAPAILDALKNLAAQGGGTLLLAPGRYVCLGGEALPDGRTHKPSIVGAKLDHFTLDGQGATLVGHDIAGLFQINQSSHVVIKRLAVDWDPLPHTSGRVAAVLPAENAFDLEPMIPRKPVSGRIVQAALSYDPEHHRLADNGWGLYQTQGECDSQPAVALPDGKLRVFLKAGAKLPEVGWSVVVRHQVYGHNAFVFNGCSDVLLEDVAIHAAPGMGVYAGGCTDVALRRVRIVPSEGGWMSTTADATHFNTCRGTVTIEDCEFAGMGDDAVNIHAMYGLASARLDDRTLAVWRARMNPYNDKARTFWNPAPAPGDILETSSAEEPLISAGRLVVDKSRNDAAEKRTIVEFRDALPSGIGEGTVLTNVTAAPKVRIRRCFVHGNRARGFLLQSRDVLVEACRFEGVSGAGVHICTDADAWWESLGARDVVLRDCVFRGCNFGEARRAAAFDIFADMGKGQQGPAGVHQRLKILNNVFEDNAGAAINIGSADGVELRGNRIAQGAGPAILIVNSRNVTIGKTEGLDGKTDVEIKGSSERGTIRVE